jgi:Replication-relaxation
MRRTLSLLDQEGLVYRKGYLEEDRTRGGISNVWGLTDRGVKKLSFDFPDAKTFDEHSTRTLSHELEISFFHIAAKTIPLQLYWKQSDLKRLIHPDAYFAFTDPAKPDGKNTFHYFLEIEKGKKTLDDLLKKLGRYHELFIQDNDRCLKEWGFKQFRVIVVQKNDIRRENLLKALAEKYPHRMFWLSTEEDPLIFKTPKDYTSTTYSLFA